MAKHYIYPAPNPDGSNADRRIELHWQRDGSVQLASTRFAGQGQVDTTITYLTQGGEHIPAQVPGANTHSGDTPLAWPGEYVDLNRDQVNHLIKQLRIARDQAFGRDE
jgi:hypothetical protein